MSARELKSEPTLTRAMAQLTLPIPDPDEDLKAQEAWAQTLSDNDFSLASGASFLYSVRDIGYKGNDTALDDLIDNSIQASAKNVHIAFQCHGEKIQSIAVIDDGHGMSPKVLRGAIPWGGTHRRGNRQGFGKYGFGLSSATLSIGKRFTVYTKVAGADLYSIELDIEKADQGAYTTTEGRVQVPGAEKASLPSWVDSYIFEHLGELKQGTVIVIENLDRLEKKTRNGFQGHLLPHLGVIFRNLLSAMTLWVDGTKVEPIDPLFLTEGWKFYDEDSDRAEALPAINIPVSDDNGSLKGVIGVRIARFPVSFLRQPESKEKVRGKNNNRFKVVKDLPGILMLRNGRQIDVVNSSSKTTFQNNDRYWQVELSFPGTMDEELKLSVMNEVEVSDRIWDALEAAGLFRTINQMRKAYLTEAAALEAKGDQGDSADHSRPSERALTDALPYLPTTPFQQQRGAQNLREEARRRAAQTRRPLEEEERRLEEETEERLFLAIPEDNPEAPFYRVQQLGMQTQLFLNKSHPFYTSIYGYTPKDPAEAGRLLRASWEMFLFTLGLSQLNAEAHPDRFEWYRKEKQEWSVNFAAILSRYDQYRDVTDALALQDAIQETTETATTSEQTSPEGEEA